MARRAAITPPAITAAQMVQVDRLMVAAYGITLLQMMENAGRHLAELSRRLLGGSVAGRRIVILCGTGNNGGGGMVAARHLHNWGAAVHVQLAGDAARLKEVPAHQWHTVQVLGLDSRAPLQLGRADLLIDALIGYGLAGDPRPDIAGLIERINAARRTILALDTPSGLEVTTGVPARPCVRATATLTLALPKTGLLAASARPFVGALYLADIGVPPELYQSLGVDVPPLFTANTIVPVELDQAQ
jgi:NAD(P)H-hydrate epimerase